MKSPTPRILSAVASFVTVFVFFSVNKASYLLFFSEASLWNDVIVIIIAFSINYFIISYLVEKFIYRKIKLIYKTIVTPKKSVQPNLETMNMGSDIIGDVNRTVSDWDKNRNDEIEELKRMEIFRKEFLGNVSHELKTPLFNIQGYIHTLIDGGIDDPEVNKHYLQRASRSVERLCLIVDDLEAISKLESGEMILEQRTFDVCELVKDVFESLEFQAKEKKISLGLKDGSSQPFYVYADKERIRQVLINLAVNSIKYGKEGGNTLAAFYDLDENIIIEITDNGIGVEPQHIPRLFERFYRVDKSRSRDQGGTGLGLSIVKHIIEAHQQTINVRSSFGIGTTFTFTLKKA